MRFFIQKERLQKGDLDLLILKEILNRNKYLHEYACLDLDFLQASDELLREEGYDMGIPVGSLEFVGSYLNRVYGISHMYPIEVPECLRAEEFLKREYRIVQAADLPEEGNYFVKDVTELKKFSYTGDMGRLFENEKIWETPSAEESYACQLDLTHHYQVSEIIDILSEFRVYVIAGEIENICCYNGDPTIFPDVGLIRKANVLYSLQKEYPKSYTIDAAVTPRGTCIIEIHPFVSVGLYSTLWGSNLCYAYRDGIEYYQKCNSPVYQ